MYHRVAFKRCVNGLNGRLGEQCPKLDGASDARVKLGEELPSTGHVMGGAGVEAPPVSLVVAGAVAEEGVCFWLVKVEEGRYGRCRWR